MIKLGIIAAGSIVKDFLADIKFVDGIEVSGLFSRTYERAQEVCRDFQIPLCASTLVELLENCDAVYIASPNSVHFDQALLALDYGKHVLCEKPVCVNKEQYLQLKKVAEEKDLIFMEAQRMFSMKSFLKLKELIHQGNLGDIIFFEASTGAPNQRLDRRTLDLAGGALMDLGVYPLFAFIELFGMPTSLSAFARFYETGVDSYIGIHLSTPNIEGHLSATFIAETRGELRVMGTKGAALIPKVFSSSQQVIFTSYSDGQQVIDCSQEDIGLAVMTQDFVSYIHREDIIGYKKRHQATENVLQLTDSIRQQISLKYPCE